MPSSLDTETSSSTSSSKVHVVASSGEGRRRLLPSAGPMVPSEVVNPPPAPRQPPPSASSSHSSSSAEVVAAHNNRAGLPGDSSRSRLPTCKCEVSSTSTVRCRTCSSEITSTLHSRGDALCCVLVERPRSWTLAALGLPPPCEDERSAAWPADERRAESAVGNAVLQDSSPCNLTAS